MHTSVVHRAGIQGVWILDQIDTFAAFTQAVKDSINHALAYNNVRGFELRIPWNELEQTRGVLDTRLLAAVYALCQAAGKEMSIRWMAGRRCPPWLYTTDNCRYYLNGNTHGAGAINASLSVATRILTVPNDTTSPKPPPRRVFQAADVGKEILVYGGGAGGTDLYTTIQSFISATQVVLTSAPRTVSGTNASWAGSRVPHHCSTTGAPNPIYIARQNLMLEMVADYCEPRGILVVHHSWWANDWGEVYGDEINNLAPATGYDGTPGPGADGTRWRAAHVALLDSWHDLFLNHPSLTMEAPTSGIQSQVGGLGNGPKNHAVTLWGSNSPYWYFLNTGVGLYGGGGGPGWSHAGQMYDTLTHVTGYWDQGGTAAQPGATNIYAQAIAGDLDWLEIYREQFAGNNVELQSFINRWVPLLLDPNPQLNPPVVGSFTPTTGLPGTPVSIFGQNFTGATAVYFGGIPASFTVVNATAITTTVPSGASTGVITVVTGNGTGSSLASFTIPASAGKAFMTYGARHRMSSV